MANNRMYLVHRPTGRAFALAKHMAGPWYTHATGDGKWEGTLELWLDSIGANDQNDMMLAMEDADDAPCVHEVQVSTNAEGQLVAEVIERDTGWGPTEEQKREWAEHDAAVQLNRDYARKAAEEARKRFEESA